jgi:hypothetical protein
MSKTNNLDHGIGSALTTGCDIILNNVVCCCLQRQPEVCQRLLNPRSERCRLVPICNVAGYSILYIGTIVPNYYYYGTAVPNCTIPSSGGI